MSARDLIITDVAETPARNHGGRAHSRIGPSAAHRWLKCPGSVGRSRHMPNRSTVFAREGTAAHEFCEYVLRTGWEPSRFLHGAVRLSGTNPGMKFFDKAQCRDLTIDREDVFAIDEEMVEAAEMYRDTIKSFYDGDAGDIVELETKLDMTDIHPDLFGTGDCLVLKVKQRHLIVVDFKYGRGVAVDAEDNEQLLTYGVGALRHFKHHGRPDKITVVIVQPRAFHPDGPVRQQDIDVIDLLMFEDVLRAGAAETDDDQATICVGDQCKWCPISHACVELREHVHATTGAKFTDGEVVDSAMPDVKRMTPEQLGRVVRQVAVIESWLKSVMRHAHEEALAGRVPTGCKIVEKRAYRHFIGSPEELEAVFDLYGLDASDYMTDPQPEMKSVAALEKSLGKALSKRVFAGIVAKKSSGYVLAIEEDRRQSVQLDKTDAFGSVEDDY